MSKSSWFSILAAISFLFVSFNNAFSQSIGFNGSTVGAASVTNMGSAKYGIPIFTLPGYQSASPTLMLEYDSALSNANSQTGVGWRMGGVGNMITRCAKTLAHGDTLIQGPRFDEDDALCLGGVRLVRTSGASNFAVGAEFEVELQKMGERARIEFDGAHFTVFMQDGSVDRFGQTLVNDGVAIAWFTSTTTDSNGNEIGYEYQSPGNNEAPLLAFINYAFDGARFNHRVGFVYRMRPDVEVSFRNGVQINKTRLLKSVLIQKFITGTWTTKYTWELTYDTFDFDNHTGTTSMSTRSRIATIQEIGADGIEKQPLVFEYNDADAPTNAEKVALRNTINTSGVSTQDTLALLIEDVDGDDIKDIIQVKMMARVGGPAPIGNPEDCIQTLVVDTFRSTQNFARVSSGVWGELFRQFQVSGNERTDCTANPGWFALAHRGPRIINPPLLETHLIDVNNDQREDLVFIGFSDDPINARTFTFLNDGNGLFIVGDRGLAISADLGGRRGSGGTPFEDPDYMEIQTTDINGDGCEDIIKIFKSGATPGATAIDRWYNPCRSNNIGVFSQTDPSGVFHPAEVLTPVWKDRGASDREFFLPFDLNGDSVTDLMITSLDANGFTQFQHFINDGTGDFSNDSDHSKANPTATYSTQINWGGRGGEVETRFLPGDMNGDGLIDLNGIQYAGSNLDNFVYISPGKGDGTKPFIAGHVSRVAVNAGAGSADDTPRFLAIDWNDDNVTDLVRIFPNEDDTQAGVALYLNNGNGVLPGDAVTHVPDIVSNNIGPWYNEPLSYVPNRNHYFPDDFNQDGQVGFIGLNWAAYERNRDTVNIRFYDSEKLYRTDLMTLVNDLTTGLQSKFEYVALADPAPNPPVYNSVNRTITDADTAQVLIPFNPGLWVVSKSTSTFAATLPIYPYGSYTTRYTYSNLRADTVGRGVAGFDTIVKHGLETNKRSLTRLNQFFPLTGHEILTEIQEGNVAITSSVFGSNSKESSVDPNHFVFHVFPVEGTIVNGHRSMNSIQKRTYDTNLRLVQQIDITNVASSIELDSSLDAGSLLTSTIDSSFNMDGEEVILCTKYQYDGGPDDLVKPILGFPVTVLQLPSNADCSDTSVVSEDMQRKTDYSYDDVLNVTRITAGNVNGSLRRSTSYTYDDFGNLVQTTDARGNVSINGFGGSSITGTPLNMYQTSETTPATDNSGPLVSQTRYDDFGDTIFKITPSGIRRQIDFNGFRRQIAIWGEDPNSTGLLKLETYRYSARIDGRQPPSPVQGGFRKVTESRPEFTTAEDDFIQTEEGVDPYGRKAEARANVHGTSLRRLFQYNNQDQSTGGNPGNGQIARETLFVAAEEVKFLAYSYNLGQQLSAISTTLPGEAGEQSIIEFTYDRPDNSIASFSFDPSTAGSFDRVNPYKVEFGSPFGEQARKKTLRNSAQKTYTYTEFGEILSVTDGLSQSINLEYNVFGQIIARQSDNNDGLWTFRYDANGNLIQIDEPRGKYRTLMKYDALNRIHVKTVVLINNTNIVTSKEHFEWDCFIPGFSNCQGKIAQHTQSQSNEFGFVIDQVQQQFSYDEYAQLASLRHSVDVEDGEENINSTYVTSYTRFPNGYVETETLPNGFVRTMNLDSDGLISDVTIKDNSGKEIARVDYTEYDLSTASFTKMEAANGINLLRTFDSLGRISSLSAEKADGTVLGAETDIVRNKTGLTVSRKVNNGSGIFNESYSYDTTGFLVDATSDNPLSSFRGEETGKGFRFTYDVEGNRLTKVVRGLPSHYQYDPVNAHQLTSFDRLNPDGTFVTVMQGYDDNGNLISKGPRNFTYNSSNQLVRVIDAGGAFKMAAFYLDNQRVMKKENVPMDPSGTVANITTRYLGNYKVALGYDADIKGFTELHTIQMPGVQGTPVTITLNGNKQTLVGQVQNQSQIQWASAHDTTQLAGMFGAVRTYASAVYQNPSFFPILQWIVGLIFLLMIFGIFIVICQNFKCDQDDDDGDPDDESLPTNNRVNRWMTWLVLFAFSFQMVSPALAAVGPGPNGAGYEDWQADPTVHYQFANTLDSIMVTTDVNGNRLNYLTYKPFGALDVDASFGVDVVRGKFNGKEFDEAAGLAYFGARYYDSETGRFATEDPSEQFSSPYRYGLQPLDGSDPTGKAFFVPIFIAGLVIGLAAEIALIAVEAEIGAIKNYSQAEKIAITTFAFIGMGISIGMMQGPIRVVAALSKSNNFQLYRVGVQFERRGISKMAVSARAQDVALRRGANNPASPGYAYERPIYQRASAESNLGGDLLLAGVTAQRHALFNAKLVGTAGVGEGHRALWVQFAQDATINGVLLYFGNGYYEGTFNPQHWSFDANSWAPLASWASGQSYNIRKIVGERTLGRFTLFPAKSDLVHVFAQGNYSFGAALIGYRGKGDRGIVNYSHYEAFQTSVTGGVFGAFWGGATAGLGGYSFDFLKAGALNSTASNIAIFGFATYAITLNGPVKLGVASVVGGYNWFSGNGQNNPRLIF